MPMTTTIKKGYHVDNFLEHDQQDDIGESFSAHVQAVVWKHGWSGA